MAPLTSSQQLGLEVATRVSSVASLLGSLFIIATFLCFKGFRTNKTRLIFYATWANIVTNAATLISTAALPAASGHVSPLCEVQGFLIQWFMLADSFWVFCMASNVWYVFLSGRRDEKKLPMLEKAYVMFAYLTPGIAPIVYLIHDHVASYRIVGPATLWCWVRDELEWMRVAFFYAPLWLGPCLYDDATRADHDRILAVLTMSIHIRVGLNIYQAKRDMRKIMKESRRALVTAPPGSTVLQDPLYSPRTSIVVTTNISYRLNSATPKSSQNSLMSVYSAQSVALPSDASNTAGPGAPSPAPRRLHPLNPNSPRGDPPRNRSGLGNPHATGTYRATAYAAPLAGGQVATLPSPHMPTFRPAEHAAHLERRRETADMYSYFQVALLLFAALVVVWVPSSINHVYQLVHAGQPLYGLNLASAIVLPTQGFWNAVIYAQATWSECKDEYRKARERVQGGMAAAASAAAAEPKDRASVDTKSTELTTRNAPEANNPSLMV
ncbi:G-protein coupled receptor 1-like protein 1 [Stagonosporopsis vannaccii]|nr:G-protein coupled receptor 1-like protein 1 [Stagonosporopsis vannaccii]